MFRFLCLLYVVLRVSSAYAGTDVLTHNYDNARTGANLSERVLKAANVHTGSFGKIGQLPVDGPVLAQPLVVSDLELTDKRRRNVLFVTTGNNSVYAFDADAIGAAPLWRRQFTRLPGGALAASTGITGTPVINKTAMTLYVVASFQDQTRQHFVLYALDLRDGRDKNFGPAVIGGAVPIEGQRIAFEPTARRRAVQRAALALAGNHVVVAFGGDYFEGWVFALDIRDLRKPAAAFCTTCVSKVQAISHIDYADERCIELGPGGGIWQSGRGPIVDAAGLVYFFTGNKQHVVKAGCRVPPGANACTSCKEAGGCVCAGNRTSQVCGGPDACVAHRSSDGTFDLNDALIVLDPSDALRLTGWFRPANWDAQGEEGLERNDLDLGGSGPMLIPGTQRLIGGGKQGVVYLLDAKRPNVQCTPSLNANCIAGSPLQSFEVAPKPPQPNDYYRHILGGPVLWARDARHGGTRVYLWRENDYLRSYRVTDRFLDCDTSAAAPTTSHRCVSAAQGQEFVDQHPGAFLTLSADGADGASGIVWASAYRMARGRGRLMAFAAQPDPSKSNELAKIWDSESCEEDAIELGSDFVPPTVANGRVYVASGANRVEVFALFPNKVCTPAPKPEAVSPMMQ